VTRRLRLGVIGAGSWAVGSHLPNLARYGDEVEFVIVNRRDPVILERIRERFGFERATTDWQEVIATELDLVVVASPAALHFEQARAALQAGAHVVCEKPFTVDPGDSWELASLAERLGRTLVVAFGWNFNPIAVEAHRIASGSEGIGEVEQLIVSMASPARELLTTGFHYPAGDDDVAPRNDTWADPSLSGGGYGQAQLSHAIGLALWLGRCRASEVFAFGWQPPHAAVEFHDAIAARFSNGAIGTFGGSSNHRGVNDDRHQLEIRMIGTRGQLDLDIGRDGLRAWGPAGAISTAPIATGAGAYECAGPIDALVLSALGRPVVNAAPGELGARTTELLDAAYRSMRSGAAERTDARQAWSAPA
jgi:predicted dehydrogenase